MSVTISDAVGGGYGEFWNYRGRYRVVKGGRASKKSTTAALWFIFNMMKYPAANTLVVRRTYRTLRDSCFAELKWAIKRIGAQNYWKIKESPLEMCYLPTGQKIYFRGLDDPLKITSLTADCGSLCWIWIEEAYEIAQERDFEVLDECLRGQTSVFKQLTLTFNPWNERHWLKARFFDNPSDDTLAMTTNYMCNEFLDEADKKMFEDMRRRNPRRYKTAGLGEWGVCEGAVFDNYLCEPFDLREILRREGIRRVYGLDFGYSNDPTALFCGAADEAKKELYVYDELYSTHMSNERIAQELIERRLEGERIRADASEPKSIDRLRALGIWNITPARRGRDSVMHGIDYLSDYKIFIHPSCKNFLREIENYAWKKDEFGKPYNSPQDDYNHLMDAMRYAMEELSLPPRFEF